MQHPCFSWPPAGRTTGVGGELSSVQPLLPPPKQLCWRDTEVYHLPPGTRDVDVKYPFSFCPESCTPPSLPPQVWGDS